MKGTKMTNLSKVIKQFTQKAIDLKLIDEVDRYYTHNRLLAIIKEDVLNDEPLIKSDIPDLLESMDALRQHAQAVGILEDLSYKIDQFEASIMDLITPRPWMLNQTFWSLYKESPTKATQYFYNLSKANDYIKTRQIAKNIAFKSPSDYGDLDITINLSKPEKDPKEIALAKNAPNANYPACLLCMQNEGYQGRSNHPARANHRLIRLELSGGNYGMQYSPYVYYNEHSIFLSELHRPMAVDRACFEHLLDIVSILPHYFAGSNADLPIVGGSILAHDHYQGGAYEFAMEKATVLETFTLKSFKEVSIELLKWPMSVLRIRSLDRQNLAILAESIHQNWMNYSDSSVDIIAHSGSERHNTITPIARRRGDFYEMDLVLRNNRTSLQFPDGIFHPHADVQHIKKENIGLIEVMGLAILPPRLLAELAEIKDYLLNNKLLDSVSKHHQSWAKEMKTKHAPFEPEGLDRFIECEIGAKFSRVLEDAGVFKQTATGLKAFTKFVKHVIETTDQERGE